MTPYRLLVQRFDRHYLLRSSADLLEWDAQAIMPEGGGDLRAAQLGTLRVLAHDAIAAPDMAERLAAAEASPPEDEWERANLASMRRAWVHAAAVPADLVEARTRATSLCELAWRAARRDDDFASLAPQLLEVVNLTRQVGEAKAAVMGLSVYDALADEYEPGAREAVLEPLFARLEHELPPLVDAIVALQARARAPRAADLGGPFPVARQAALGRVLAERMGFDFTRGRLDVSAHPVLRRRRRGRAHDHALRRARLPLQRPRRGARDRPCPLRDGPAAGVGTPAGGAGGGHGDPREPVAPHGDAGSALA